MSAGPTGMQTVPVSRKSFTTALRVARVGSAPTPAFFFFLGAHLHSMARSHSAEVEQSVKQAVGFDFRSRLPSAFFLEAVPRFLRVIVLVDISATRLFLVRSEKKINNTDLQNHEK
eukprot:RCo010929